MMFGLDRTPFVWIDEATLNSPAYELATHGQLRSAVFADNPIFQQSYYWQPPGQALLTASMYKVFGFGIWQTRVPQILCASLMVMLLMMMLHRIIGNAYVAMASALCFALDPLFIYVARSGRMDAQCVLFVVAAVWFGLKMVQEEHTTHWTIAVLCGLSIGIAGITHPIAIAYGIGLGCILLITHSTKPLNILLYAVAAAFPVGVWILRMMVVDDTTVFVEQFLKHGTDHLVQLTIWEKLLAELQRYIRDYRSALHVPILFVLIIISSGWFIIHYRKNRTITTHFRSIAAIVFLLLVSFGFNMMMMTKEVGFYTIYPSIMLYSLLGIVAGYQLSHYRRIVITALAGILVLNVATGIGLRYALTIGQWEERSYHPLEYAYRKYVPQGEVVFGSPELWYAAIRNNNQFRVRDYFSSLAYPQYSVPNPALHNYVALRADEVHILDTTNYTRVATYIQPLQPLFGMISMQGSPYNFSVWKRNPLPLPPDTSAGQ